MKGAEERVVLALRNHGFLLLSHESLPSVVGLVARAPVRGSWWSHPDGRAIFRASTSLEEHPDTVVTKLIDGRVTFVHRRYWPALLGVAASKERWQLDGLSAGARQLLRKVESAGAIAASGDAVRELERRVLVHVDEVHTESGAHAKVVERWPAWAARVGFRSKPLPPGAAKAALEQSVHRMAQATDARATLPWQR
jgi:hypothetical protein